MNPTRPSISLRQLAAAAAVVLAVVLAFSAVIGHPHVRPLTAAELRSTLDVLVSPPTVYAGEVGGRHQ